MANSSPPLSFSTLFMMCLCSYNETNTRRNIGVGVRTHGSGVGNGKEKSRSWLSFSPFIDFVGWAICSYDRNDAVYPRSGGAISETVVDDDGGIHSVVLSFSFLCLLHTPSPRQAPCLCYWECYLHPHLVAHLRYFLYASKAMCAFFFISLIFNIFSFYSLLFTFLLFTFMMTIISHQHTHCTKIVLRGRWGGTCGLLVCFERKWMKITSSFLINSMPKKLMSFSRFHSLIWDYPVSTGWQDTERK